MNLERLGADEKLRCISPQTLQLVELPRLGVKDVDYEVDIIQ